MRWRGWGRGLGCAAFSEIRSDAVEGFELIEICLRWWRTCFSAEAKKIIDRSARLRIPDRTGFSKIGFGAIWRFVAIVSSLGLWRAAFGLGRLTSCSIPTAACSATCAFGRRTLLARAACTVPRKACFAPRYRDVPTNHETHTILPSSSIPLHCRDRESLWACHIVDSVMPLLS